MNEPLLADDDYKLWVLLHQTRDAIYNIREKECNQYGVTAMECAALFIIDTLGDKAIPAEISRWMFREHHTVSALLNRMEKKGLITKAKDPRRKNIWRVSLTQKGREAHDKAGKKESIKAVTSVLSKEERKRLASYLKKLRDKAINHPVRETTLPFP